MKKISIASDHGGFNLKEDISLFLNQLGFEVNDLGPSNSKAVDYPDYGISIATYISDNIDTRGIVICGTGVGMSIVVNRFPGIRGALCSDIYTAKLSREHNDSNLLVMGGRVVGVGLAREIVQVWLNTPFEGGRHIKRIEKIPNL
jgi:ribose 5-phosphate isomerase B|tara:strand:+ start:1389 stop:1823 length:435 start_codon:yes stop_codon:yes gene_type:complete